MRRLFRSLAAREAALGYVFILPSVIGVLVWQAGPMLYSIWLSLTDWDVLTPARFIGFANFSRMTREPLFWKALFVTFYFTIVIVPLNLVAGFAVALLLNTKVRGMAVYRTIYYLPTIVPQVASAILWLWLFNSDFGLLNAFLGTLGVPKIYWLQDERWVMPAFWLMSVWGSVGAGMIIYLAGLQGIPQQLYEAADVDGASAWRKLWHITIPQMSPIIFFNLVMGIIGTFQVFTPSYLITSGGPQNATLFYVLYLYRNAFEWFEMGYAAALAWVLFVIILILTLLVFKSLGSRVYYEDVS